MTTDELFAGLDGASVMNLITGCIPGFRPLYPELTSCVNLTLVSDGIAIRITIEECEY